MMQFEKASVGVVQREDVPGRETKLLWSQVTLPGALNTRRDKFN